MKVSMELNVSDKEFYDLMMKSLKEEVKNVTKKNLELKEGLKYKKKSAQRKGIGSEITVHIKRLIRIHCMKQRLSRQSTIQPFLIRLNL